MAITVPGKSALIQEQTAITAQKTLNLQKIAALEAQNAQIEQQQAYIASTLDYMRALTFLAAPSGFVATPTGPTSADLTWTNDVNAEVYVIMQATQEGFSDAVQIYDGPYTEALNVTDLTTGVTYHWEVKAKASSRDDSTWSTASATISE